MRRLLNMLPGPAWTLRLDNMTPAQRAWHLGYRKARA